MLERARSSPLFITGFLLLLPIALGGLLAPWIAPYDPNEQIDVLAGRFRAPMTSLDAVALDNGRWLLAESVERTDDGLEINYLGKSRFVAAAEITNLTAEGVSDRRFFLLGTDKFSRDVFSRLLYGARVSLFIGLLSILLALSIGIAVGALAALSAGWIDSLLMRFVDGLLAFPWFFLLITLAAVFPAGQWTLVLILGGTTWMGISRLARGELLKLLQDDFIIALRGVGAKPLYIFFRHLLPNSLTPLMVSATLRIGGLVLVEASLSFLNLGVPQPQASWGNMIADGRYALLSAWWTVLSPGFAIVTTVIAINLIGDGLRDLLDPRQRQPAGTP